MANKIYSWFLAFTLALMAVLVVYLLCRDSFCIVEGNSMEPTLGEGQIVLVRKLGCIRRGDVILLRNPLHKNKVVKTLKRCMAVSGDTLLIERGQLYVNGRPQKQNFCQFNCKVLTFSDNELLVARSRYGLQNVSKVCVQQVLPIQEPVYRQIIKDSLLRHVSMETTSPELHDRCLFPFSSFLRWNKDFYGPVVVPRKGLTIRLSISNVVYYKSVINSYENAKLEYRGGVCYIDGKPDEEYTFKRDYYFYLNDYRDDVSDSRTFGPVPVDYAEARLDKKLFKRN